MIRKEEEPPKEDSDQISNKDLLEKTIQKKRGEASIKDFEQILLKIQLEIDGGRGEGLQIDSEQILIRI